MIELFTADTPNGWKISIMLEEINLEYKIIVVCIMEQLNIIKKFSKLYLVFDSKNLIRKKGVNTHV